MTLYLAVFSFGVEKYLFYSIFVFSIQNIYLLLLTFLKLVVICNVLNFLYLQKNDIELVG